MHLLTKWHHHQAGGIDALASMALPLAVHFPPFTLNSLNLRQVISEQWNPTSGDTMMAQHRMGVRDRGPVHVPLGSASPPHVTATVHCNLRELPFMAWI